MWCVLRKLGSGGREREREGGGESRSRDQEKRARDRERGLDFGGSMGQFLVLIQDLCVCVCLRRTSRLLVSDEINQSTKKNR